MLATDNAKRRTAGLSAIRMRIGLHTRPAIVGKLGAPGRINHTLVGDTVNTAQRLEQLAKTKVPVIGAGEDATIETAQSRLEGVFTLRGLGPQALRGRSQVLGVYAL